MLQWAFESVFEFGEGAKFSIAHQPGIKINHTYENVINISLVSVEQINSDESNLASEMYAIVNDSVLNKHVYCGNGRTRPDKAQALLIRKRCEYFLLIICTVIAAVFQQCHHN